MYPILRTLAGLVVIALCVSTLGCTNPRPNESLYATAYCIQERARNKAFQPTSLPSPSRRCFSRLRHEGCCVAMGLFARGAATAAWHPSFICFS